MWKSRNWQGSWRPTSLTAVIGIALAVGWAGRPLAAQDDQDSGNSAKTSRGQALDSLAQDVALLEKQSNVLKKVVKLVSPTVVRIDAEKADQLSLRTGSRSKVEEAGSGYVVKLGDQYYVITNRHVIKYAATRDIKIELADGRVLNPTKVWSDPETDVAVMAVSAPRLIAARLGNSNEVEIGDFVLAVGSPFGLSHSVTFGIISGKGRRELELGNDVKFQDFIQTDAAINPGNSGGPLINLRAEVIGMNTAIASSSGGSEGIGFTIPVNVVMSVARQLVERGSVVRGFLGIALDEHFSPAMATTVGLYSPLGARVTKVTPGSPAEIAKLQPNDVILEYGGMRISNWEQLRDLVHLSEIGQDMSLTVFRDHKMITIPVKVGSDPSARPVVKRVGQTVKPQ